MDYFDRHVLESLIYLPFVGAAVLCFIPSYRPTLILWVARAVGLILLVFSIYVFIRYFCLLGGLELGDETLGFQFAREYPWLDSIGISFKLAVDGISVPMILLTGVAIFTGTLVSWRIAPRNKDFFILLFLLVAGVYGTFASMDLFFLFFFYELAVLPMYLLIGVWGSSSDFKTFLRTKEYGAMKLVLYLVAGSVLVWVAILAIYVAGGLGTFDIQALGEVQFSQNFQRLFFPLVMVGFGVLAGLWPFHTWSPDGHVAAPTAVSMLHAGVLMKLGAYGIIRVGMELLPHGAVDWMPLLIVLGTINVIYGAVSAVAQTDLKYVVGYSSISHMGYVLMGLATLEPLGVSGAVLQMFSHGVMTALFFALVGVVYDRAHVRDITLLEGLAKRMGWTAVFFAIAGFTSLGLPGLSGFVAELLVFLGTFRTYPILGVLAIIGAAITAVYILRLLAKVFFGPISARWQDLPDATWMERFAMGILVITIVSVGIYPGPFLRIIDDGVSLLLRGIV